MGKAILVRQRSAELHARAQQSPPRSARERAETRSARQGRCVAGRVRSGTRGGQGGAHRSKRRHAQPRAEPGPHRVKQVQH
jgi:hypothetical protein